MEQQEYEVIFNLEDKCWWYVGLRQLIFSFIDKFSHDRDGLTALDAGCGTGIILEKCNIKHLYGLEISEDALKFCKLRKLNNLVRGDIYSTPFKENSFDTIISLDTLYHSWIEDDVKALEELYRIMKTDGILLLNLPAYNFLKSSHDKVIHTRHRYTKSDLKYKLENTGFKIETITYRNSVLFPLAAVQRIFGKFRFINKEKTESDLKSLPEIVNRLFIYILNLENRMITAGFSFPFGLSICCVARKI